MAVHLRLTRQGAKKAPFYRVVVADSRSPRDGRFIEHIGIYDPTREPAEVRFDEARLKLSKSRELQQMERRNDSTTGIEGRELARLLRGDKHFSTRHSTKASIDAVSRQDLIDLHDRYYYPANFIFEVSGDFRLARG